MLAFTRNLPRRQWGRFLAPGGEPPLAQRFAVWITNLRPHWFKGQRFCVSFLFYIYHVSPHETQNPDEFVNEICLPVVKA